MCIVSIVTGFYEKTVEGTGKNEKGTQQNATGFPLVG